MIFENIQASKIACRKFGGPFKEFLAVRDFCPAVLNCCIY